ADQARLAETAFVIGTFASAKAGRTVEKIRIGAALTIVERAVIAGENNDRAFVETKFLDERQDAANIAVHACNHGGIGRMRLALRKIAAIAGIRLFREFSRVFLQRIRRHLQGQMRHRRRVIQKERAILVGTHEVERFRADEVGSVILAGETRVAGGIVGVGVGGQFLMSRELRIVQLDLLVVVPEMRRIIVVGDSLTVVAEPAVETLFKRSAAAANRSQSPLAETAQRVPLLLEQQRQLQRTGGNRRLSFRKPLGLAIIADVGVPRMLAGHQHAARRRADIVTRVVGREAHSLTGQAIKVRRLDLLLPIATEIAVAEIVGNEEDDIGWFFLRLLTLLALGQPVEREPSEDDAIRSIRFVEAADGSIGQRGQAGIGETPLAENAMNRPGRPFVVTEEDRAVLAFVALRPGKQNTTLCAIRPVGITENRRHATRIA